MPEKETRNDQSHLDDSQFRRLVDSIEDYAIFMLDTQGNIRSWNKGAQRLKGYTQEEILGKHLSVFYTDLDNSLAQPAQELNAAARNGRFEAEGWRRRKDGTRFWANVVITALYDPDGKIEGYAKVTKDLTDRRREEERFRQAVEAAPNGMVMVNSRGQIELVNDQAARLFGYGHDEMVGQMIELLVPDGHRNEHAHKRNMYFDNPRPHYIGGGRDLFGRRKDGSEFPVEIGLNPIETEDGMKVLAAIVDISERKLKEEALKNAITLAEQMAKVKSQFLANMSHEIRTPMNGILGLTQLTLNRPLSPELRDYLEKINTSSQGLLGILNDILDFSKVEAGGITVENDPFDLDRLLDNLRSLFEDRARAKLLDFRIEVASDIPRDLIGDAMRIQQILANLLGNAIKFTDQGHVALKVSLCQQGRSQAQLRFTVEDSGIGIPAEHLDKLFQPFSQVDGSITRKYGGTGLGLSISRSLLQLMGGEFAVESRVGEGSRFSFELLLGIASLKGARNTRHRTKHEAGELTQNLETLGKGLRGARVLVAEDNSINQKVVKEFLNLSGINVMVADNGQEVLDMLRHEDFDAILMDVHMPLMGGIEVSQKIRADSKYADTPIIALTADVVEEDRNKFFSCGMNDFVSKPIHPQTLITTLSRWIIPKVGTDPVRTEVFSGKTRIPQRPEFRSLGQAAGLDFRNTLALVGNDHDLLVELLKHFGEDMEGVTQKIWDSATAGDLQSAYGLADKVMGASGNMGATNLHSIAAQLTAELKTGNFDTGTFAVFQDEFSKTLSAISTLTGQQPI